MKKKSLLILIMILGIFLLAACGDEEGKAKKGKTRDGGKDKPTETVTVTPTEEVPTPTPTEEPTPEPTGTPTPTPLPDPDPLPEIIDFNYEEPNRAIRAFAEFLDAKLKGYKPGTEAPEIRFGLVFLNSDKTPELWWATGGSHVDSVNLCMYDGKKVVELGAFGEFANCMYIPRCHTIVSTYSGMGTNAAAVYLLNETEVFRAVSLEVLTVDTPDGSVTSYFVDGTECSKEDSEKRSNAWQIDTAFEWIRYENGLSSKKDGYDVLSTYEGMYNQYLSFFTTNPFQYGIPDDILKDYSGKWELVGGEVEGWEWKAAEEGMESNIVLEPNGEMELNEIKPNKSSVMYRLTFEPKQAYISDIGAYWLLSTNAKSTISENSYYYVMFGSDGNLVLYFVDWDNMMANVRYYKRVQ